MMIVFENTDFLNEVTDYMWWSQSPIKPFWSAVSPQRLSRLYSLEGEVKQLSQKHPECKGSFFLWGKSLYAVQASNCPELGSSGIHWGMPTAYLLETGWELRPVSSWKETRKRIMCSLRGSITSTHIPLQAPSHMDDQLQGSHMTN